MNIKILGISFDGAECIDGLLVDGLYNSVVRALHRNRRAVGYSFLARGPKISFFAAAPG